MSNIVVHTETLDETVTINIIQDDCVENPFKACDCEPDIIGWHRNYDFNTRKEDNHKDPKEFLAEAKENNYLVLPLYMYEHSGIAFSTSRNGYPFNCPFDSDMFGFIFLTREKIAEWHGEKYAKRITKKRKETLLKQLENSVNLLNDYVSGDVYGYVIEDTEGEVLDSCYGYYGDYVENALKEARSCAEWHVKNIIETKAKDLTNLALTLGVAS